MTLEWIRMVALGAMALHAVFFLDAPFLTFGQKRLAWRWQEQIVLNSFELALLMWWVMAKWRLGWERALVPAGATPAAAGAGLALVLAGVGLTVWAKLGLGRWFVAGFVIKQGHRLVTGGPYAVTRHPMYTGVLATFAGVALVWDSALTLLLGAGFCGALFMHSVIEEALLEHHFGETWREYRSRVPRFVPFLRPRRIAP